LAKSEEYDYEPNLVQGAIDSYGESPVTEPILAQLDEWSRYTIMTLLYEWDVVDNPHSGKKEKKAVSCRFPDIENALGYALSHHNLIVNFTWEESRSSILDWRGKFYRPLMYKYRRDNDAQTIITALDAVFVRNVMGGSAGGSHQGFLWRLQGGYKGIQIERGEKP